MILNLPLVQKLKKWYTETAPSRVWLQKLLKILHGEGLDVPLSAETLMGKRDQVLVRNVFPGIYCHIGVEKQLKKIAQYLITTTSCAGCREIYQKLEIYKGMFLKIP